MAEISPPEFRGSLMAMEQFSIVLGCVLGFWAGFLTRGGMSFPFLPYMIPPDCTFMMTFSCFFFHIFNIRNPTHPHAIQNGRALDDGDPARQLIVFLGFHSGSQYIAGVFSRFPRDSALCGYSVFVSRFLCFFSSLVEGSASWRIPLGVQLIPGIALAIGCVFLPPSPRLLVAQGRNDEALKTLARLRLRSELEAQDDPLLQVRIRCLAFHHPLPPFLRTLFLIPVLSRFCSPVTPLPRLSCLSFSGRLTLIPFVSYPLVHTFPIGDALV